MHSRYCASLQVSRYQKTFYLIILTKLTSDPHSTTKKVVRRLGRLDMWLTKLLMSQSPYYLQPALLGWSLKQPSSH